MSSKTDSLLDQQMWEWYWGTTPARQDEKLYDLDDYSTDPKNRDRLAWARCKSDAAFFSFLKYVDL